MVHQCWLCILRISWSSTGQRGQEPCWWCPQSLCSLCALLQVSCIGDSLINNLPVRNFHYCAWCQTRRDLQWVSVASQSNFRFGFLLGIFGPFPWGQLILQKFCSMCTVFLPYMAFFYSMVNVMIEPEHILGCLCVSKFSHWRMRDV